MQGPYVYRSKKPRFSHVIGEFGGSFAGGLSGW